MNPTTAMLEQRVAEMEGGIGGLAVASGIRGDTPEATTLFVKPQSQYVREERAEEIREASDDDS